jgi:hypothetical protein
MTDEEIYNRIDAILRILVVEGFARAVTDDLIFKKIAETVY